MKTSAMSAWFTVLVAMLCATAGSGLASDVSLIETFLTPPNRPSRHDPPAYVSSVGHRAAIVGDIVYLADGSAGLSVYSLSDPARPKLIGEYETGEYTQAVHLKGNRLFTTDLKNGTVVFDIVQPGELRRADLTRVPDLANGTESRNTPPSVKGPNYIAAMVEQQLYIAQEGSEIGVIELRSRGIKPSQAQKFSEALSGRYGQNRSLPFPLPIRYLNAHTATAQIHVDAADMPERPAIDVHGDGGLFSDSAPELSAEYQAGVLKLRISGRPGQVIRIQRSSSVDQGWNDWQAITLGDTPVELTDEEANMADQVFYRAVAP